MNKDAVAEMSQPYQVETAQKRVPEGYKQTEVGVIPEDWNVAKFGEIGKPIIGLTYSPNDVSDSGTLVLRSSNVQKGKLEYKDNVFVDMELPDRVITQEGDILICVRNGSRQLIGKCALIDKKAAGTAFGAFMSVFRTEFYKFIFYQFQSDSIKNQIEEMMGATINQITNKDMSELIVAMPSCSAEQTAIANVLSDTDALLSELEKLIAKKQAIKTATMQQLLTGRTRLPQFANHPDGSKKGYKQSELGEIPEDWGICNLSDFVLTLESGVSVNSIEQSDAFSHGKHVLKTSCVEKGYFYGNEKKSILPNDLKRAKCTPKAGCIIVSRMNTPSLVGEIGYVEKDCSSSFLPDRLWQIIFKKDVEVNTRWLAYFLSFPDISGKIKEAATGTSGSMKNISKGSFLSLALSTPNLEEQTAIATILSDMDAEIQALEHRLNKTRQIKQGMMQELLTGKTRLLTAELSK